MKLILHKLGSNLTGGCMNPASVMGWAFARGDHISKGAHPCIPACPYKGHSFGSLDVQISSTACKKK
ncbi:MIP aquaporin (TC 1.A.8) [Trifolium repens]|nr:MIP aquaporin (TC 1.A.8) [Trifolium repens]